MLHYSADVSLPPRAIPRRLPSWVQALPPPTLPFPARPVAQDMAQAQLAASPLWSEGYVTRARLPNMVRLRWVRAGDRPTRSAAGTRTSVDRARGRPDTLYRIYSMTKPITGMATIMLIDEGKLALDQPLHEILPAFANMQVQKSI